MSHRAALVSAVVCVGGGVNAAAASAFEASADVHPSTISYYGENDARTTRAVEDRLELTSGPQEEHVIIDHTTDMSPVVDGDATVRLISSQTVIGDDFGSPGRDGCPARGTGFVSNRYEIVLPPQSTSTVIFERRLGLRSAPASGRELVATFRLAPTPTGGPEQGSLPDAITVQSPEPTLVGVRAAKLSLRVGVAGSGKTIGDRDLLPVGPRRTMAISGTLSPGRRGDRVTIWAYSPHAKRPRRLAVKRVDSHGRFLYRPWRPATLGIWELYATWAGRPGAVEKTRSPCGGPQIKITNAPGDGKPQQPQSTGGI